MTVPEAPRRIRIGELAQRARVNIQTVRYYERRGLLDEADRSNGGHREFDEDTVTLIRGIKAAQNLGFTLSEIADMRSLTSGRSDPEWVRKLAEAKLSEIDARIESLLEMKSSLGRIIEARCDSLVDCSAPEGCPIHCLGSEQASRQAV